jgi:hypothetical protein
MLWTLLSVLMQAGIALASVTVMVALAVAGLVMRLALALCCALWRAWRSRQAAPTPAAAPVALAAPLKARAGRATPRPRPFRY